MPEPRRTPSSRSWLEPACILAAIAASACETVVVSMVEIGEVEVVPPVITLVPGEAVGASAVVIERGGGALEGLPVTWMVDDPSIASVTGDGVVEAKTPGTTTLRASSDGVSGAATVRVLAPSGPDPEPDPSCGLRDQLVLGRFEVPPNTRCVLTDVRVLGNLELREGGSLVGTRITVSGRLNANRAAELLLDGGHIVRELRSERGGDVTIRNSRIERTVTLRDNVGGIHVSDSQIDRTLELVGNRGGPITLYRNTAERLECRANDPAPTGEGNVAEDRGGQCEGL